MVSVSELIPQDLPINREDYKKIEAPGFYLGSKLLFCDENWDAVKRGEATHIIVVTRSTEMRIGPQAGGVICRHMIYCDDGSIHEVNYGLDGQIIKVTKGGL